MSESDQFQIKEGAAQFYDRLPARYILGPWAASLVAAAQITLDEHVLDLACGTGVVTICPHKAKSGWFVSGLAD